MEYSDTRLFRAGFIKSTEHRAPTNQPTTDYLLTEPPNHRPPNHRPTDPILTDPTDKILFKRLYNRKISILQNTNTAGEMLNCTSVYYLLNE